MSEKIEIPKSRDAQISAIFIHLNYIRNKMDEIEKGKAPMWAATAWRAVFYGVGTAVLGALLGLILIKPSAAQDLINTIF